MPKNKRDIDRGEKLREIIESAHMQFLHHGYEGTSMVKIAKASGVVPNTIYWYFKNKDELFARVIDELVRENLKKILKQDKVSLSDLLQLFFTEWKKYRPWALTLHQRLPHSEALKEVHDNFHEIFEKYLYSLLKKKGVPQDLVEVFIRVGEYTFEGMLMHFANDSVDQKAMDYIVKFVEPDILSSVK